MRKALASTALSAWLLAFSIPASANEPAPGSVKEDAKAAFAEGKRHFENSAFINAAAAFRKANELMPSWKLYYSIGQADAAARRYGLALESFENYLAIGGDAVPESRREEVIAELVKLRAMVGSLEISAPAGSRVFVDDVFRGETPLPGILKVAAATKHRVVAVQNGVKSDPRTIRVSGGDTAKFQIEFPVEEENNPVPTPVASGEPEKKEDLASSEEIKNTTEDAPAKEKALQNIPHSEPQKTRSGLVVGGWISMGIGAAALIGGSVMGGLALSIDKEVNKACEDNPTTCQSANQTDIAKSRSFATVSTILFGVGGAAVTAGLTMLLVGRKKSKESGNSVSLAPIASPEFTGAIIQGRF